MIVVGIVGELGQAGGLAADRVEAAAIFGVGLMNLGLVTRSFSF